MPEKEKAPAYTNPAYEEMEPSGSAFSSEDLPRDPRMSLTVSSLVDHFQAIPEHSVLQASLSDAAQPRPRAKTILRRSSTSATKKLRSVTFIDVPQTAYYDPYDDGKRFRTDTHTELCAKGFYHEDCELGKDAALTSPRQICTKQRIFVALCSSILLLIPVGIVIYLIIKHKG